MEPILPVLRVMSVKPPLVGTVYYIAGALPDTCVLPTGQLLSTDEYPELFSVIGHAYSHVYPVKETWWQWFWRKLRGRPVPMQRERLPVGTFRLPNLR